MHALARALLLCLALLGLLATPAAASRAQDIVFQDDALLLARGDATQAATLAEVRGLGATEIHAIVYWPRYVPGNPRSRRKPRGNSARPSYYPAGKWDPLDSLVRRASSLRMKLLLTPSAAAVGGATIRLPRWAQNRDRSPKTGEFRRFAQALARRYSGRYRDENAGGGRLPRVKLWSVWNEPNQGGWVQPQWRKRRGKLTPWSPVVYRRLYRSGRSAIKRTSGHRSSRVYWGELAPIGRERDRKRVRRSPKTTPISPGLFMRESACLNSGLRRMSRRDRARRPGCRRYRRVRTNGINHHFYTKGKGQPATYRPPNRDEFMIGVISRMERLVRRLGSKRRFPRNLKIYNTEFGFQSNPPNRFTGVSQSQQARNENVAEYLQYRRSRVRAFTHYLMVDDPCQGRRCGGFQTGLKMLNGTVKPAYAAFRMPIVARRVYTGKGRRRRLSNSRVAIWGAALGRRRGRPVEILRNGSVVRRLTPRNSRGYFSVRVRGSRRSRYQLRDPATGTTSRVARVEGRRVR